MYTDLTYQDLPGYIQDVYNDIPMVDRIQSYSGKNITVHTKAVYIDNPELSKLVQADLNSIVINSEGYLGFVWRDVDFTPGPVESQRDPIDIYNFLNN